MTVINQQTNVICFSFSVITEALKWYDPPIFSASPTACLSNDLQILHSKANQDWNLAVACGEEEEEEEKGYEREGEKEQEQHSFMC